MHKNFSKCSRVNVDFSHVKIIELLTKYSLVSTTVLASCNSVLQQLDLPTVED